MRFRWLFLLSACTLAMARAGTAAPLAPHVLNEIVQPQRLPEGDLEYVGAWSAPVLPANAGRLVVDREALSGRVREGMLDRDRSGHLGFGPYTDQPAGAYLALFRVRLFGEPAVPVIGQIDACTQQGTRQLALNELDVALLPRGRYVRIPLWFVHTGGKLECRIQWNGGAPLRYDGFALFRYKGPVSLPPVRPRVDSPVPHAEPSGLRLTGERIHGDRLFPRSAPPASELYVLDMSVLAPDRQLMAYALQGLVNRSRPRLYVLAHSTDKQWLDHLVKRGWIRRTRPITLDAALKRYRSVYKGVVVTDPRVPATVNVATMLAGCESVLPVTPRLAARLELPIVHNLNGRWTRNAEAYEWVYARLKGQLNRQVSACLWPMHLGVRDYLVQHRIPIFWLPGALDGAHPAASIPDDMRVAQAFLAGRPANTPVMGYPWAGVDVGMGEGQGVSLLAEYGQYLVGSVDCTNLSVHSGVRITRWSQREAPSVRLDPSKVYVAITMSDGDNVPVLTANNWPQLWISPERGATPIGWTITPASAQLIPGIMDWYYSTAHPNDAFLAAVSGVGYTYPALYGKRYVAADRQRVLQGFLEQTAESMRTMALRDVCPTSAGVDELAQYARHIDGLRSMFADYGRVVASYDEATFLSDKGVPVFRAVNSWDAAGAPKDQIPAVTGAIRTMTPATRPAFMHVFLCNWFFDLATVKQVVKALGPDYVAVLPAQLSQLYRQYATGQRLVLRVPQTIALAEDAAGYATVHVQNTGAVRSAITLNSDSALPVMISPEQLELDPGVQATVRVGLSPGIDALTIRASDGQVTRAADIRVVRIPRAVLSEASVEFVRWHSAVGMAHHTGRTSDDREEGPVQKAEPGVDKPGHMTFGPYTPLEAGRFTALFRMRRTGSGPGSVATLDTCVAGAPNSTAVLDVTEAMLPEGQWVWVALPFTHPGGPHELRAFWQGNHTLEISAVVLMQRE